MSRLGSAILLGLLALPGCRAEPTPSPTQPPSPQPSRAPEIRREFQVPTAQERMEALGPIERPQARFYDLKRFEPMRTPQPREWLAEHPEKGQTFEAYRGLTAVRPRGQSLGLQPVGELEGLLPPVREYLEVFFQRPVRLRAPWNPVKMEFTQRDDIFTRHRQLLATDVLKQMKADEDTLAELAVTRLDLYPREEANFVFGLANPSQAVGVFSFARYDPAFFRDQRPADWKQRRLERACKLMAHETGHMLGMAHCIYFNCLMNGVNHLAELDSRSFFLCPVCLHKLQWRLNLDLGKREKQLQEYCRRHHLRLVGKP